jgi:hypothetical protein
MTEPKTKFYTKDDRDRLIWQALTLAADAVMSLQMVQEFLNDILRTCDLAEMPKPPPKPAKKTKRKTA